MKKNTAFSTELLFSFTSESISPHFTHVRPSLLIFHQSLTFPLHAWNSTTFYKSSPLDNHVPDCLRGLTNRSHKYRSV